MKVIALEEHVLTPALLDAWSRVPTASEDGIVGAGEGRLGQQLLDIGDQRLRDMDTLGVDVQVLSVSTPGVQNLAAPDAPGVARDVNDALAAAVAAHPDRFEGFAAVPTPDPGAAADELRRAIGELGMQGAMLYGRTGARNMDQPELDELYRAAADLHAPLYIHPQAPLVPVRQAIYSGFGEPVDSLFSRVGIGWHYEAGVQLLRLIFSGAFDRHPELQVIVGHWGEVVLFYVERIAEMQQLGLKLDRPLVQYLRDNVSYTGSGLLSERYLRWTLELVGVDRVMYSVDYPYVPLPDGAARRFLAEAPLAPADREKIAHGNWERLTAR
jgi:uncharacterized protein